MSTNAQDTIRLYETLQAAGLETPLDTEIIHNGERMKPAMWRKRRCEIQLTFIATLQGNAGEYIPAARLQTAISEALNTRNHNYNPKAEVILEEPAEGVTAAAGSIDFSCDLDMIPGSCHTPEWWVEHLRIELIGKWSDFKECNLEIKTCESREVPEGPTMLEVALEIGG